MKTQTNGKRSSNGNGSGATPVDPMAAQVAAMSNKDLLQFLCDVVETGDWKGCRGARADLRTTKAEVLQRMKQLTEKELFWKVCYAASGVQGNEGSATIDLYPEQAKIVDDWFKEQFRLDRIEQREFDKKHKELLRTNPEYRKSFESARLKAKQSAARVGTATPATAA